MQANEILSDAEKKRVYDESGEEGINELEEIAKQQEAFNKNPMNPCNFFARMQDNASNKKCNITIT